MRSALEKELRSWVEAHESQLPAVTGKKKKKTAKGQKKISRDMNDLNKELARVLKEERENLQKQHSLYQEKLERLNKTISTMKRRADDRYELLVAEKETVGRRLEQTSKEIASLNSEEGFVNKSGK
ncbi:MAG: hypothetical protein HZC17_03570 [Candidatus Omnitrophica bacterium]|nr:hypothetical protein [Candidatus Omnitrophota bacterium]